MRALRFDRRTLCRFVPPCGAWIVLSVILTAPYSVGAVHGVVTPSGQSMPISSTRRCRASSVSKPGETAMKHFFRRY
jgi:hypothetical protein